MTRYDVRGDGVGFSVPSAEAVYRRKSDSKGLIRLQTATAVLVYTRNRIPDKCKGWYGWGGALDLVENLINRKIAGLARARNGVYFRTTSEHH